MGDSTRSQEKNSIELESLKRLSQTLVGANVGVWQLDFTTGLAYWNEAHAKLMGYPPDKSIADKIDFFSRVHPDDHEKLNLNLKTAMDTCGVEQTEFRVVWPNGEIHWVSSRSSVQYDSAGIPVTCGGILINIDEKKESEIKLQFREQGFLRLYESNLIGISFWNIHSGVYEANDAYLKIVGMSREEFDANKPFDWKNFTPSGFEEVDEIATRQALECGVSDVFEKEYYKKDGTRVPILIGIALQSNSKQNGIAFVLDISQQKNADILLRRSHERYASFISQSSEGIWRFEMDVPLRVDLPVEDQLDSFYKHAYLAECNDALAKMYGYTTADEVIGARLHQMLPRTPTNESYLRAFVESSYNLSNAESEEVDRYGRTVYISNTLKGFVEDGLIKRAWGLQRDITAQKQTESELIRAREQAESANSAKTNFIANVSHEIRTPLGAILGFSEFLQDTSFKDSEKNHFREIIRRNGQELTRLIDDILDLSKVEAGHIEMVHSEFGIDDLVADVFGMLQPKAEIKSIRLVAVFDDSSKRRICSDATRARQVLINLVTNAIKFTEHGEVTVEVGYQEGLAQFTIRDTGIGISHQSASGLFRPFSQGDNSTTRRFGGTGLGLALSKKLAQALGGDVLLQSSFVGKGSTFCFTLKDFHGSAKGADFKFYSPQVRDKRKNLQGVRVLVVDDSPDNRLLMERLLKKHGIKVDLSVDGANGVQRALSKEYDVVLMDLQMPIMDGYTATKVLRQRGYKKPIIALTAHAMTEDRNKCLNIGCSDHMGKPVSSEELLRKISIHA